MLTKENKISKIEITELRHVQVRISTCIMEDGVQLSETYHRYVLSPGDDLTAQDPKVRAVANAVWTPEVIAAYKTK